MSKFSMLASLVFIPFICHAAIADAQALVPIGNACSLPISTPETDIQDNTDLSQKIPITECGANLINQSGYLANDLICDENTLNTDHAAVSLIHSTLDMNGKKIIFNGPESSLLKRGIFITQNSKVFDNHKTAANISGFYTGIDIRGSNNNIKDITIENSIFGVVIHGNNNKIKNMKVKNIGGVVDVGQSAITGEAKGFDIHGDHNKLSNNISENIGYNGEDNTTPINSMYGSAAGVRVTGNHNIVEEHKVENIFVITKADINAQATVWGVELMGSFNTVERTTINKIEASGTRINEQGLQTGGLAYGILLSNTPEQEGQNLAFCNTVNNVFAKAQKVINPEISVFDITAEAYGIAGFESNQQINNNMITKIDAKADFINVAAGIRVVFYDHVVLNNIVKNIGQRSLATKIVPDDVIKVSGISIDAFNARVENNEVHNTLGYGISVSMVGSNNLITGNNSYHNTFFDYLEKAGTLNQKSCRNDWSGNQVENSTYDPVVCFE